MEPRIIKDDDDFSSEEKILEIQQHPSLNKEAPTIIRSQPENPMSEDEKTESSASRLEKEIEEAQETQKAE